MLAAIYNHLCGGFYYNRATRKIWLLKKLLIQSGKMKVRVRGAGHISLWHLFFWIPCIIHPLGRKVYIQEQLLIALLHVPKLLHPPRPLPCVPFVALKPPGYHGGTSLFFPARGCWWQLSPFPQQPPRSLCVILHGDEDILIFYLVVEQLAPWLCLTNYGTNRNLGNSFFSTSALFNNFLLIIPGVSRNHIRIL